MENPLSAFQGHRFLSLAAIVARGFMLWRGQFRSFQASARLVAVLAAGVGMLAGATPADAQTGPAPTRFRVEAVRHVSGGDAEVDLTWLYPTRPGATGFTVHYELSREEPYPPCDAMPADPQMDFGTAGGGDRRITIRTLDRETSACFWIRADFGAADPSDWTLVESSPIDLRDETPIGTIPAPGRPRVLAGDARVTVSFSPSGNPGVCHSYAADGAVLQEFFHARWFYTRRLEVEPFGDDPTATVEVVALKASGAGSHPVVQNIANGQSYVFKIRLQCLTEISPWSEESAVVTPRSTAEELTEPQGLSVVPIRVAGRNTAALRVTWVNPSSDPPDRYRLQYYRGAIQDPEMAPPWTSVTFPGSSRSYDITGLSFNAEYQIWLRAEAEEARPDCDQQVTGRSGPCGPWAKTSGNTGGANRAPVAVDDLEAIVLVVGSTRPVDVAHYFSDPDGDELTFLAFSQNGAVATVALSGSTATITAVRAGEATVSVSATDPGGLSARIGIEVTVQEEPVPAVPAVPVDVEAFIGPTGPAVLWEPPAPVAGVLITGYKVSWRDDVNRVWKPSHPVGADVRTWPTGVPAAPGRTYEFRVRAVSADGDGPWSAPATVEVPELTTPSSPLDVEAFIGPDGPAVLWEPPRPVPGADISRYDVSWRTDVNRVWSQAVWVIGGAAARTWAPRVAAVAGRTYEFRVRAVSAAGAGAWSVPATVEVSELPTPSAPLDVEAFIGPDGPAVLWEPPAPAADAVVVGYEVSWRDNVDRVWSQAVRVTGGAQARTWAPMVAAVAGRTYEFRVRALSAGGAGPWSAPATVEVPELPTPSAPLNVRLAADGGDLVATWDEPADIDSVPVTGYTLRFRGTGIDDSWRTEDVPAGTLRLRIPASDGLVRGGTYRVQVRALGAAGAGPWSAEAETTIPEVVLPGLPVWLEPMEVAGGGIALSWQEPGNAAEATVSGYEVAIWSLTALEPPASANVLRQSDQLGHTYQPGVIPPGCQYTARVRAVGENGRSDYAYMPATLLSGPVCEDLLPAAPTGVKLEVGPFSEVSRSHVVSVEWTQGGDVEPQFHVVRFSSSTGVVNSYHANDQPRTVQ